MKILNVCLSMGLLFGTANTYGELNRHDAPADVQLENALEQVEGWLVYEVKAKPEKQSVCCWQGSWRDGNPSEASCELGNRSNQSFGSSSDFPVTEKLKVFAELKQGSVRDLLVVGEHCNVQSDEPVLWLGQLSPARSIDWLGLNIASQTGDRANQAIAAIAWHDGDLATDWLEQYAIDESSRHAEQAVFWLGNERGSAGLEALQRLLEKLPAGEARRRLPFAVAQNKVEQAADLLLTMGRHDNDREQREQAWFWLAQEFPARAAKALPIALRESPHINEAEQMVFALSQLPEPMATDQLLALARSDLPLPIRRKALFWLAQSDDERAIESLTELLQ